MHPINDQPVTDPNDTRMWYKTLNRYQWFVLAVAAMGWMLDCLDQQLFILARPAAMEKLIDNPTQRSFYGNLATFIFIIGWASGGLVFGMLGDRIGRARTMLITILLYSVFTGLSAFSVGFWDFALYRFLTGLGVGGEFAAGVALVAEVMPQRARPYTLALLQALSAIGNVSAALIYLSLGAAQQHEEFVVREGNWLGETWRMMFIIGALPALLVLIVRSRLKEPETWQKVSHDDAVKKQLGSYRELLTEPSLRRRALLGLVLGCSGIIGLWSVGFFTSDLIRAARARSVAEEVHAEELQKAKSAGNESRVQQLTTLRELQLATEALDAELRQAKSMGYRDRVEELMKQRKKQSEPTTEELKELQAKLRRFSDGRLSRLQSYTSLMQNIGAAFGMFGFGALAQHLGRKKTFLLAFLAAFGSSVMVWTFVNELWQIFLMVPIMGFCQLSLFAGYAIYFPELFPTRLRSTGTSFCYNVGRFVAAFGLVGKEFLEWVFRFSPEPFRYAGIALSAVFLIGIVVLPFLPETKGKPLPE